ncbi:sugar phosphate isomerase/epimerase family protein [Hufsiella ginkgonis]|uniref:TIM barrel protein n=1 Tax=Hufsiella ginkgonis TaxID=2695274 RepID=A0A7K1XVT3_9SPHI|nr:sugar phosphate isomerase/epimerase [Hufsiella ginkgonis]MXV15092.1 TIM barrel protein [Hufsiella ginkgonis]
MTTRRDFLKQAGIASASALVLPQLAFRADKAVGLQLYSLREYIGKDVKGVLAKVAAAGYREVETYGYSAKGGFWGLPAKEFAKVLKDNGLKSPSGHYDMGPYLASNGTDDSTIKAYIEAAHILGSPYVTIPWFGGELTKSADGFKKAAAMFSKAAELCKKSGLQMAYHNHDFEFKQFGDVNGYDILLKETDASLLKMEADLYWVVRAGKDPLALFSANPGRYVMWHIKDMDKTNNSRNTEVGNGQVDFKKIFAHAKHAGVKHFFVEQENFTDIDPYVSITKSAQYVKKSLF